MNTVNKRSKKIKKIEEELNSPTKQTKLIKKKSVPKKAISKKDEDSIDEEQIDEDDFSAEEDDSSDSLSFGKSGGEAHSGRPYKPTVDLDEISSDQEKYEDSESQLLYFLGANLQGVPGIEEKPKLDKICQVIEATYSELSHDCKEFDYVLIDLKNSCGDKHFNLSNMSKHKNDKIEYIFAYLLIWICKYTLKQQYHKDVTKIILFIYFDISQIESGLTSIISDAFQNIVVEKCQNLDFEFGRKLNGSDKLSMLKEFIKLICSTIYYAL